MEITFEKATSDDAVKLLEIQKKSFQEALMLYHDYETNPAFESVEKITHKIQNHLYYKIVADGNIVGGMHIINKGDGHYYLNRLFVHSSYENAGLGTRAMLFMETNKAFEDAAVWVLETPHKSYKNHHFYEKLGFVRTGYVEEISENLKLIHYQKIVKDSPG